MYELDFIVAAILHPKSSISHFKQNTAIFPEQGNYNYVNYVELCKLKDTTIYTDKGAADSLALINMEDELDANKVSGIDVVKPLTQ